MAQIEEGLRVLSEVCQPSDRRLPFRRIGLVAQTSTNCDESIMFRAQGIRGYKICCAVLFFSFFKKICRCAFLQLFLFADLQRFYICIFLWLYRYQVWYPICSRTEKPVGMVSNQCGCPGPQHPNVFLWIPYGDGHACATADDARAAAIEFAWDVLQHGHAPHKQETRPIIHLPFLALGPGRRQVPDAVRRSEALRGVLRGDKVGVPGLSGRVFSFHAPQVVGNSEGQII